MCQISCPRGRLTLDFPIDFVNPGRLETYPRPHRSVELEMAGGRSSTGLVSAAVRLQVQICEVVMTSLHKGATLLRKKGLFAQGAFWPRNWSYLIIAKGLDAIFRSSRPLRGDYEFATDRATQVPRLLREAAITRLPAATCASFQNMHKSAMSDR